MPLAKQNAFGVVNIRKSKMLLASMGADSKIPLVF